MTSCQSNPLHTFAGKAYNNKEVYYSKQRVSKNGQGNVQRSVESQFVGSASLHRPTMQYPRTVAVLQDSGVSTSAKGVSGSWLTEFQHLNLRESPAVRQKNTTGLSTTQPQQQQQLFHQQAPTTINQPRFSNNDSLFKFQDHPIIEKMSPMDLEAFYEKEFVDIDKEFGSNWSDAEDEGNEEPISNDQEQKEENKTYEYYNEFTFNEQQSFQDSARDILKNVSETQHEYSDSLNDRLSGSQFVKLLKNIDTGSVTLKPNEEKARELLDKDNNLTYGHHYVNVPDNTNAD